MEKLFALDGKFNQFMSKAADLLLLNLMWMICSLPIITIGASTTALFEGIFPGLYGFCLSPSGMDW